MVYSTTRLYHEVCHGKSLMVCHDFSHGRSLGCHGMAQGMTRLCHDFSHGRSLWCHDKVYGMTGLYCTMGSLMVVCHKRRRIIRVCV